MLAHVLEGDAVIARRRARRAAAYPSAQLARTRRRRDPDAKLSSALAMAGVSELRRTGVTPWSALISCVHRQRAVARVAHAAHVLWRDAVIARAAQLVGGQPLVAQFGKLADVGGRDPVVPQRDQRLERAETIPERAHLAQVGRLHAVLTGAHELGGLRLGVALLVQLVDKRVSDVVPRHLVLLACRRPREAALRELRREVRIGRERKRAGADAAANDALERERAGVASQPELHRPAVPGELRGCQPFQPLDRNRSNRRTNSAPTSRRRTVPVRARRTDFPRAGQVRPARSPSAAATRSDSRRDRISIERPLHGFQLRSSTASCCRSGIGDAPAARAARSRCSAPRPSSAWRTASEADSMAAIAAPASAKRGPPGRAGCARRRAPRACGLRADADAPC